MLLLLYVPLKCRFPSFTICYCPLFPLSTFQVKHAICSSPCAKTNSPDAVTPSHLQNSERFYQNLPGILHISLLEINKPGLWTNAPNPKPRRKLSQKLSSRTLWRLGKPRAKKLLSREATKQVTEGSDRNPKGKQTQSDQNHPLPSSHF